MKKNQEGNVLISLSYSSVSVCGVCLYLIFVFVFLPLFFPYFSFAFDFLSKNKIINLFEQRENYWKKKKEVQPLHFKTCRMDIHKGVIWFFFLLRWFIKVVLPFNLSYDILEWVSDCLCKWDKSVEPTKMEHEIIYPSFTLLIRWIALQSEGEASFLENGACRGEWGGG